MVGGGAVPVLLAVGREMYVTWADLDDLLAPCLHQAASFGDIERLAALVRVPGRACARCEVNGSHVDVRSAVGWRDRVDPHITGEPVGRSLDRGRLRLDSHGSAG